MTQRVIDLFSDTRTRPTPEMRRAIAEAKVGDDMAGLDPTVNRLEEMVAEMFGKEAAVFACSGTQSNQLGVWAHCQPAMSCSFTKPVTSPTMKRAHRPYLAASRSAR